MPSSLTFAAIALLLSVTASPGAAWAAGGPMPSPAPVQAYFDRVEGNRLFYKPASGEAKAVAIQAELFDLKYLGTLSPASGEPYFLVTAKPCDNCNAEAGLHALRPGQGKVASFVYPGKLLEARSHALALDSRAFYGRCLSGYGDVYVVYQREKVGKKHPHLQTSVFIAEAAPEFLREKLLEKGKPDINRTLRLVRSKQCHEISGRNRVASAISLTGSDRLPTDGSDKDEGDDDEDESPAEKPQAGG